MFSEGCLSEDEIKSRKVGKRELTVSWSCLDALLPRQQL
jgi:hypothetical protein